MEIRATDLTRRHGALAKRAERMAARAASAAGSPEAGMDIFLVGAARMRSLNKTHRGKDTGTNVLSFSYALPVPHPEYGKAYRGEVYLCPSHIKAHKEDFDRMTVHGALHLLGYDHETKADAKRMERLEEHVLRVHN
ncbi:MAG: rRNA maturation RNase YbeY [Candidatus Liptonbacteria bacterium]|nr:rRNA maturation RNase YbeY [Candidatus Liptonbacteria bacterium]